MNLNTVFRFWPVRAIGVSEDWVYGTYLELKYLPYREVLEKGRLRSGSRRKGRISQAQLEASFRQTESLSVVQEGRTLVETDQLDEAQFTEPVAVVSEETAAKALLAFLNLPYRDESTAVQYINDFGEFDDLELDEAELEHRAEVPNTIRQFCRESQKKRLTPFAVPLSLFWAVRDEIEALWNLAIALDTKDLPSAREQCLRRRPNSARDPDTNWALLGRKILCADLSAGLYPPGKSHRDCPRFFLSSKHGSILALTMAKTVRSGLYLALFDLIASKTEYKRCPNCGGAFIVTVKRKKYCTGTCQNAAKVKRFRERQDTNIRRTSGNQKKGAAEVLSHRTRR